MGIINSHYSHFFLVQGCKKIRGKSMYQIISNMCPIHVWSGYRQDLWSCFFREFGTLDSTGVQQSPCKVCCCWEPNLGGERRGGDGVSKTKPSTTLGNLTFALITCSEWPFANLIYHSSSENAKGTSRTQTKTKWCNEKATCYTAETNYTLSTTCPDRGAKPAENQHLYSRATPREKGCSHRQSSWLQSFWYQITNM